MLTAAARRFRRLLRFGFCDRRFHFLLRKLLRRFRGGLCLRFRGGRSRRFLFKDLYLKIRELFFLRHIHDFMAEQPREPLLKDVWLADLQIMAARRGSLYLAMKGGTNGESHNHNDVGSFIVYADNEPLLIDPGVGEYTAKTFSKDRYSIWTMQSQFHNLPQINGADQKDGKEYAAKVVSHKDGQLTLDLAGAYPEEAAVKVWRRTVSAAKKAVTVTEDYVLDQYRGPSKVMLLTTCKPQCSESAVTMGSHRIDFDARQMEAAVEDISDRLDPLLRQIWGEEMYRIVLTVKSTNTQNKIKYTIR